MRSDAEERVVSHAEAEEEGACDGGGGDKGRVQEAEPGVGPL